MSNFLGIDIGTQSVKVLCYDAQARQVVDSASAELKLISDSAGTREQLAQWWLQALRDCLGQIDKKHKLAVAAVGVSGQQHGFVPLDAAGDVLAPVKLWCDTVTADECAQITQAFGGQEQCIQAVGNAILPGYTAGKIRWLKNHRHDLYKRLHTILLPHDYINYYLTGELAMECGDASGTGLLDVRNRSWHVGMLAAVDENRDLSACLPPLVSAEAVLGEVRESVAQELGLPAGIPVAAGGGDNMMAAIGTGNVCAGRMTVSLGTSGTLFAYSDTPIVDEQGQLAAFCASTGGWLPLLCTMNCTVVTELTRDLFRLELNDLDTLIETAPVGAEGVVTLPFFSGERTPNLPNGKGCILGLDANNYSRANVMRSAMEAAVYGLRAGLDAFKRENCAVAEIRLTGGGARNGIWRQMVADVFNLPVAIQTIDEGAALGAALQACWMDSHRQSDAIDITELVDTQLQLDPSRACRPDAETAQHYDHFYHQYLEHVEAIAPLYA